jgi:hypothetical protein
MSRKKDSFEPSAFLRLSNLSVRSVASVEFRLGFIDASESSTLKSSDQVMMTATIRSVVSLSQHLNIFSFFFI